MSDLAICSIDESITRDDIQMPPFGDEKLFKKNLRTLRTNMRVGNCDSLS